MVNPLGYIVTHCEVLKVPFLKKEGVSLFGEQSTAGCVVYSGELDKGEGYYLGRVWGCLFFASCLFFPHLWRSSKSILGFFYYSFSFSSVVGSHAPNEHPLVK